MTEIVNKQQGLKLHWLEEGLMVTELPENDQNIHEQHFGSADEVAFLLLSGGSTDIPKLIPKTHNQYELCIRLCSHEFNLNKESVYLAINPFAHTSSLGCPGLLGTLLAGGMIVIPKNIRPEYCFNLVKRFNVTFTCLVPPMVRIWTNYAKDTGKRLPDNMIVEVGSAKFLPSQALEAITFLGGRLTQWFGTGEGLLTRTKFDDSLEVKTQTQGSPVCDADEILIVDDFGNSIERGKVGELITRGPYTISRYWGDGEELTLNFTEEGYFRTGDLARITPEGNLIIEGRIKDVINKAGEKISINDIEEYFLQISGVLEIAVVGDIDEKHGEKIIAFCAVDKENIPNVSELRKKFFDGGIAQFKYPDEIVLLDKLPKTAVGKIDKRLLRERYLPR